MVWTKVHNYGYVAVLVTLSLPPTPPPPPPFPFMSFSLPTLCSIQRPPSLEQPKPFKAGISKPQMRPGRMKCGCPVYLTSMIWPMSYVESRNVFGRMR